MLDSHRLIVGDAVRTGAFHRAIHEVVRAGDVVADLGTGTGILALFACQASAARVYAIEKGGIIEAAREVAAANGYQDRVIFIEGDVEAVTLPEPVDVIVGELLGVMAVEENFLRLSDTASRRYLKPGGRLIPQSISICMAPWEAPAFYQTIDFWAQEQYELDFSPLRAPAMNHSYTTILDSRGALASPESIWKLSLPLSQRDPMIGTVSFTIQQAGILHGFAGWFEALLSPSVTLSTSPFAPPTHWQQAFFPLEAPLGVRPGDQAFLTVSVAWAGERILWGWDGKIVRDTQMVGSFSAHTFRGMPLSLTRLRAGTREALPDRSEEGEIMLEILSGMDGKASPAIMLAERLSRRFPGRFGNPEAALLHIDHVIRRWGKKSGRFVT